MLFLNIFHKFPLQSALDACCLYRVAAHSKERKRARQQWTQLGKCVSKLMAWPHTWRAYQSRSWNPFTDKCFLLTSFLLLLLDMVSFIVSFIDNVSFIDKVSFIDNPSRNEKTYSTFGRRKKKRAYSHDVEFALSCSTFTTRMQ